MCELSRRVERPPTAFLVLYKHLKQCANVCVWCPRNVTGREEDSPRGSQDLLKELEGVWEAEMHRRVLSRAADEAGGVSISDGPPPPTPERPAVCAGVWLHTSPCFWQFVVVFLFLDKSAVLSMMCFKSQTGTAPPQGSLDCFHDMLSDFSSNFFWENSTFSLYSLSSEKQLIYRAGADSQ